MDSPEVSRSARIVSALELFLGAAIVIGHNVYRVVPNEVPILFVLGLLSFRLRDGGFSAMGFKRPASWWRVVGIAAAAAAVRIAAGQWLIEPFAARLWPPAKAPAGVEKITGDLKTALIYLAIVWTFAAFGEEISYRGYLLGRAADVFGRSPAAYVVAVVVSSVLFGYGHFYKGYAGVVDSGFAGLVLGVTFLVARRNLWAPILAHGFIDTFGVVCLFFGWTD